MNTLFLDRLDTPALTALRESSLRLAASIRMLLSVKQGHSPPMLSSSATIAATHRIVSKQFVDDLNAAHNLIKEQLLIVTTILHSDFQMPSGLQQSTLLDSSKDADQDGVVNG